MTRKRCTFDQTIKRSQQVERPEKYSHLFKIMDSEGEFIAQGAGLSYSPASMNNGVAIDFRKFDRILDFDSKKGLIRCEAGINLWKLLDFVTQKGWMVKVLPGYPSITVGGCVAFNVHGKSQYHSGNFGESITQLTLYHPAYGEVECSRGNDREVLDLTIGGMGFTGVILDVTLQLEPLKGNTIEISKHRVDNLSFAVELLKSYSSVYDSVYSWHDLMQTGETFGRGFIFGELYRNADISSNIRLGNNIAADRNNIPINIFNLKGAKLINEIYLTKELKFGKMKKTLPVMKGAFPIKGQEIYYYLYGKNGFREYQFIVAFDKVEEMFLHIKKYINKRKQPIGLASLKLFKGSQSYLNFAEDGVCLALDVPNIDISEHFFNFLDELCIATGSIMNLSKDSRLSCGTVQTVYREYDLFKRDLLKYDNQKRFNSVLRENLHL